MRRSRARILAIADLRFAPEQGLLGVAVDPEWPTRPYVYFEATQATSIARVTMYTASGDLTDPSSANLQLGNPFVLLGDIPDLQGFHQGGTLRFGVDRRLYVSLGDDGSPCEAQDLTVLTGKILRLDVSSMHATD